MIALIDCDIVAYRCAAACAAEPFEECQKAASTLVDNIVARVGATDYLGFFTPENKNHFRYVLYPEYKGQRPSEKPVHLVPLKEFMYQTMKTHLGNFCEADDMLRMHSNEDTITCTIDKDDLTYPGWKYNFVTGEHQYLDEKDAWFNFYSQMLIGDAADNIKGVAGIGKKKAPKILGGLSKEEMHQSVIELYDDPARFVLNYNLFQMWPKQWTIYDGVENKFYNNREDFDFALEQLKESVVESWKNAEHIDQKLENDLN